MANVEGCTEEAFGATLAEKLNLLEESSLAQCSAREMQAAKGQIGKVPPSR